MSVPVTTGTYAQNETTVYTYLTGTMRLNKAASCAVLANLYRESGFNHRALGDNGTSYGLCQWHDTSTGVGRWTRLKNYCQNNNLNATTVKGQISYLHYELQNYYSAVWSILTSTPNTAEGCWEAAAQFCARFEVPAGYGSWNNGVLTLGSTSRSRGDFARSTYWSAYSGVRTSSTNAENKGAKIVAEARRYLGMPYVWGGSSPSTSFDCSGFTYYVLKNSINYDWSRTTAYYQWKNYGRSVSDLKAGDLIFFIDTYNTGMRPNISHVGIATGNGKEFIHCASSGGVGYSQLDNNYFKPLYYATKRLVSDSETSLLGADVGGSTGTDDISISSTYLRTYNEELASSLEYIESQNAASYKSSKQIYGYLIDLTNGGEFKFYVPEYDVSTRPSWDSVSILGRSASIQGYNSTESKSIPINLTLVAGSGMYERGRGSRNDRVADMLDDLAFLDSLGYPDYSKSIVLPPPTVLLYLNPYTKIKGIVSDISIKYLKPYDNSMRPMRADVSFTVTHTTDSPPDYSDIRNHKFEGASTGIIKYNNSQEDSTMKVSSKYVE